MRRNVWGAVLVTTLALGGLVFAGYGVYQAGYRQGLAETAAEVVVPAWGYGFFPPFGFFFGLIFVFLLFGLIGRLFFGGRWRGGPYRRWEHDGDSPMERRLTEWHDNAHSSSRTERGDTANTT